MSINVINSINQYRQKEKTMVFYSVYCIWTRNGGVWFLLKPAGYSRDRRGNFLKLRRSLPVRLSYFIAAIGFSITTIYNR